ncbi:hypothetical protein K505DRAFT_333030 [Melanomma pulvis-pyrius CBS 109.77]|uniref:Uncharacterized protein n=1 Tax=Melanomma pulvis-pyrius CBS 109.77 TaxID=1314802 RepID=A0A6A6XR91_9PLEO|nr:hypothetical protein K505DRAFT_333030 [Melanomma pulvis-pyrius CBS 109.77]
MASAARHWAHMLTRCSGQLPGHTAPLSRGRGLQYLPQNCPGLPPQTAPRSEGRRDSSLYSRPRQVSSLATAGSQKSAGSTAKASFSAVSVPTTAREALLTPRWRMAACHGLARGGSLFEGGSIRTSACSSTLEPRWPVTSLTLRSRPAAAHHRPHPGQRRLSNGCLGFWKQHADDGQKETRPSPVPRPSAAANGRCPRIYRWPLSRVHGEHRDMAQGRTAGS